MHNASKIYTLGYLLLVLFFMASLVNCGGNSSQAAQATEELIKNYIAKHETMVDQSLADYYIDNEKDDILAQINLNIDSKKQDGSLQNFQHATFDFSGLKIDVVDQKEEYIDDEAKDFMKIATSGNITMKMKDNAKKISINNVIILEKEGRAWKVTEKINPWG